MGVFLSRRRTSQLTLRLEAKGTITLPVESGRCARLRRKSNRRSARAFKEVVALRGGVSPGGGTLPGGGRAAGLAPSKIPRRNGGPVLGH